MTTSSHHLNPAGGSTFWTPGGAGYASERHDWTTPAYVFAALNGEFAFDLDACASGRETALCEQFYTPEDDALTKPWDGTVWLNPPYGRTIGEWLEKATREAAFGNTVVALVPARPDTAWWHDHVMLRATEVRFIRGRLRFGAATSSAPFPSAVSVFGHVRSGGPKFSSIDRDWMMVEAERFKRIEQLERSLTA